MDEIKVFIVDDHSVVREGLSSLLGRDPGFVVVGEAQSGEDAIRMIPQTDPDVAIVDLRLPTMTGLDVAREIAERRLRAQVVILSAFVDPESVYAALLAGARAYVVKDTNAEQLISAVKAAARGETSLDPKVAGGIIHWAAKIRKADGPTLRPAERNTLRLASLGKSTAQIAKALEVSPNTVKFYLQQTYAKLGVATRSEAIALAIRHRML